MAVAVTARGEGIELGHREVLFHTPLIGSSSLGALARNQYDVTGDGRRFLVNLPREDVGAVRLTVVVNWSKGLPGS
jgi:hypothetical protein